MKTKSLFMALGLIAGTASLRATVVNVPDGSFEGLNATMTVPLLLGATNRTIGAWSAKLSSTASLAGSLRIGPATSFGGPTPLVGTYEMDVHTPLSLGTSASISEVLTNVWQPNTTYTLTVGLSEGGTLNLLSTATLSLQQGTTNIASLSGTTLVGLLNGVSGFKTVTLTYKTSNTVPTNGVGVSLNMPNVLVSGDVYVNDFQLTVVPNQIVISNSVTTTGGAPKINMTGTGGAPGETYQIVTSTNLAMQLPTWSFYTTNKFDANGNFFLQIPIDTNTPCRFFDVVLP